MTPRANQDQDTAPVRYPRTIFAHAHEDGANDFPPDIKVSEVALAYTLIPDNWNGLDKLYLWLLGTATEAETINVTVDLGSANELYNAHTQTVNGIAANMTLNEYEVIDLTALFATVLGNLAVRDMIRVSAVRATGDAPILVIGIELQET